MRRGGNAVARTIDSDTLRGRFDFSTDSALSGNLGDYPAAGRLVLTGSEKSSARLAEEGAAAGDANTVFASVDTNGDCTADASEAALAWASLLPRAFFAQFENFWGHS